LRIVQSHARAENLFQPEVENTSYSDST